MAADRPVVQSLVHPEGDLQKPFDIAVVIPTVIRPSLRRTVHSVFDQSFQGRVQILIGVDKAIGDRSILAEICAARPERMAVTIFDPGYSTSVRHGGLHLARDGGVLRTVLSYLANARMIAYLDDDNWWAENHLFSLYQAIRGVDWAFGLRWYVDPETSQPLCIDEWESVSPDRGVFAKRFGGFVDPNSLMIEKSKCEPVLRWWSIPLKGDDKAMSADRNVFGALRKNHTHAATGQATAYYCLDPEDGMHRRREQWISGAG
jgi:hypothetical protein